MGGDGRAARAADRLAGLFPALVSVRWRRLLRVSVLCIGLCAAGQARATVTVAAYWRLGEDDGAIPGDPMHAQTIDSYATYHLDRQGSLVTNNAYYTAGVAGDAFLATASNIGLRFDNAYPTDPCFYFIPTEPMLGATDNWGIETWAKAASTIPVNGNSAAILYSGTFAHNGYGLYQVGGQYTGVLGGSTVYVGSAPVSDGWTHLALVRDGELTTFYVNGVSMGTDDGVEVPAAPTGGTSLAALSGGADPFAGSLDEVRMFTFEPGQFSVDDLLINQRAVPEPSSLAALLLGAAALLRRRRSGMGAALV